MRILSPAISVLLLLFSFTGRAQGVLSGGIESQTALYRGGSFGSNNYLKLDYLNGRFSAGMQVEYYPEPLLGYDLNLKGFGVPGKYLAWTEENWSLTAGDFYDQFGTGVIFRSWEDRTLGWNNSVGGGRATFRTTGDRLSGKILYGAPRRFLGYAPRQVAGGEVTVRIGPVSVSAAVVDRIEERQSDLSSMLALSWGGGPFTLSAEYVGKKGGHAETAVLGFADRGISASMTFRRLEGMLDRTGMNYLPALCQQQVYMLATLNPYTTFANGEIGGMGDLFYRFKTWKFHVGGSMIYALPSALVGHDTRRLCYRDINIDVEKKWSRKFKTVAFVSIQENSPSHGQRKATNAQNVFVLDGLYKFNSRYSLRAQFQYLYSEELTKDWMAAMLEAGFAPHWSVHVSDMYNHGDTREHYYEAGVTYAWNALQVALSYGHQRAGYVCSGGVCRWQPEYTGGILRLSYNF